MENASILYRLDEQDKIVFIGDAWLSFALANDGVGLEPEKVIERSLYDFIAGETTCLLYRDILRRVRNRHSIRFPFRCDAPTHRRLLEMTIHLDEHNLVEFATRPLWVENRSRIQFFVSATSSATLIVRMCGWCKRVEMPNQQWTELEEAVAHLRLFDQVSVPQLSHGICDDCSIILKKSWTDDKRLNAQLGR